MACIAQRAVLNTLGSGEAFEVSMAGTRNMASSSIKETRSETKLLIARIRYVLKFAAPGRTTALFASSHALIPITKR
jgi:hypothetical protein